MSKDTFNRTLDFNQKLKYFLGAWALIEVVLADAVNGFINILINQHSIHVPKGFDPQNVLWGESVVLNIIKLLLVCGFAFLFGVTYAYLARKVLEKDKASISVANAVVSVLGITLIVFLVVLLIQSLSHSDTQLQDGIAEISATIKSSAVYSGFLIAQLVGAGIFSFIGLSVGQTRLQNLDEEDKGKLLGIKWYHYLWLWPAISVYTRALLWLVYFTLHSIIQFIQHTGLKDVLGATAGDQSNSNSFGALGGRLFLIYIVGIIIFSLVSYQREILSGERKTNLFVKILSSAVVAFVIPILLSGWTVIGASYVR